MLIHIVASDMSRFAYLLSVMDLTELAQKYEALADKLRNDPSVEVVNEARVWVSRSFGRGSGSLSDRYLYTGRSINEALNAEYEALLQKLTDFANDA